MEVLIALLIVLSALGPEIMKPPKKRTFWQAVKEDWPGWLALAFIFAVIGFAIFGVVSLFI